MFRIQRTSSGLRTQQQRAPLSKCMPGRVPLHVVAQQRQNPGPLSNVVQHVTALTQVRAHSFSCLDVSENHARSWSLTVNSWCWFLSNVLSFPLRHGVSSHPFPCSPALISCAEIRLHEHRNGCHGGHKLLCRQRTRPVHCAIHHVLLYDRSTGKL